jgi:glycosyltransferase involved in cell wall biosynthesis
LAVVVRAGGARKLRILHIATLGVGGAAEAARRIHRGILAEGEESSLLFLHPPPGAGDGVLKYPRGWRRQWRRIRQRLDPTSPIPAHKRALAGADLEFGEAFTSVRSDVRLEASREYRDCDLVHFHWTGNFLDWPSFFRANRKPIVWSLCDLNPLTGGCHYSRGCEGYVGAGACEPCPILAKAADPRLAARAMAVKREAEAMRRSELVLVPPSEWMRANIRRSHVFSDARTLVLPHPGEESTYRIRPRASCREELGLAGGGPILLFVGEARSRRKGYDLLATAARSLPQDRFTLLLVGDFEGIELPKNAVCLGPLSDSARLAAIYGAADIIAIPSREENLALTFIDSQMCGTPALVFAVGGLTEHLRDGENGILAGEPSEGALAAALRRWLGGTDCFNREQIAGRAAEAFAWGAVGPRYLELYRELRAA